MFTELKLTETIDPITNQLIQSLRSMTQKKCSTQIPEVVDPIKLNLT